MRFDIGYNFYADTTFIKYNAEKAPPQFTTTGTTVTRRRITSKTTPRSDESGARGVVPDNTARGSDFSNFVSAGQGNERTVTMEDFESREFLEDVDVNAAAAAEVEDRTEEVHRIIGAKDGLSDSPTVQSFASFISGKAIYDRESNRYM